MSTKTKEKIKPFQGTKGDWYYQNKSDAYTNIVRSNQGEKRETIWITSTGQTTKIEAKADAFLIAAAPDLLKSLRDVISKIPFGSIPQSSFVNAEKAIEKALILKSDSNPF